MICRIAIILSLLLIAHTSFAQSSAEPLYYHPFDLGAGGASLTKASSEGILFSNPSLLPFGGKLFRWLGFRSNIIAGKDSVDLARDLIQNGGEASNDNGDAGGAGENSDLVEKAFNSPIHVGVSTALSFVTLAGGFSAFSRLEPDIQGETVGTSGVPTINLLAEGYGGAVGSLATPLTRWMAFGVTGKYLYLSEKQIEVPLTDIQNIDAILEDAGIGETQESLLNHGVGFDAGLTLFSQSKSVDYTLALKADDVGGTSLTGDSDPKQLKQTASAGVGLTFHSTSSALHLAADYRDITKETEIKDFKRYHLGAKLTLLTYLGFAAGIYHGSPSYGIEMDLLLFRFGATSYTREYGINPGDNPRSIYILSLSTGFDF